MEKGKRHFLLFMPYALRFTKNYISAASGRRLAAALILFIPFILFPMKFTAKKIAIKGNKSFPQKVLLSQMSLRQGDEYDPYKLRHDITHILEFYRERGFFDVKHEKTDMKLNFREKAFYITIKIQEGHCYTIKKFHFTGNHIIADDVLKTRLKIKQGQRFKALQVVMGEYAMMDLYSNYGYAYCVISDSTVKDTVNHTIDIYFIVDEGKRAYFGDITIEGIGVNKKIIKRHIFFKKGEGYNPSLISKTKSSLYGTGLFKIIKINKIGLSERADTIKICLTYVPEKKRNLGVGFGYLSPDWIINRGKLAIKNLFNTESKMQLSGEYGFGWGGGRKIYVYSRYESPYILNTPLIFYATGTYNKEKESTYKEIEKDANTKIGYVPKEGNGIYFSFFYNVYSLKGDTIPELKDTRGIEASGQFDRRDNMINPKSGSFGGLSVEKAGGMLGGINHFLKWEVNYGNILSLKRLIWELFIASGKVYPQNGLTLEDVGVSELFILGGVNSLRGYGVGEIGCVEDSITEKHYLNEYVRGTIQFRKNVFIKHLYLTGFLDWARFPMVNGNFYIGVGSGIYFVTPVGPLRIEYAKHTLSGLGNIYFTLGRAF